MCREKINKKTSYTFCITSNLCTKNEQNWNQKVLFFEHLKKITHFRTPQNSQCIRAFSVHSTFKGSHQIKRFIFFVLQLQNTLPRTTEANKRKQVAIFALTIYNTNVLLKVRFPHRVLH